MNPENQTTNSPVVPQTPVIPVVPAIESKKNPPILIILLVILLLLSLVSTAFLYYQNMQLTERLILIAPETGNVLPVPDTTTPTEPGLEPVPAADETANWKTYTNSFWKISFKYPDTLFTPCPNYSSEKEGVRFWESGFTCPDGHDIPYKIAFIGYETGKYTEHKKPINTETILLGGKQVQKKTYIYDESDGPLFGLKQSVQVVVTLNSGTLVLEQWGVNTEEQKAFNQILSTFKFTNQ